MKKVIRLTENDIHRLVKNSTKRVLNEMGDYEGNDLDYDRIKSEAEDVIYNMSQNGEPLEWRNVAQNMGFRIETLNGEDIELLKDAIEEAMLDNDNEHWADDATFANDFNNLRLKKESLL